MPIFRDDTDQVDWMRARAEAPPPPPPLQDPPERPLFAPDPPDGRPARRGRAEAPPSPGRGEDPYWPWDSTGTGTGAGGGRGVGAVLDEPTGEQDRVPGRSWLRLALLLGVATVVLVLVAFTADLLRGGQPLGVGPAPDDESSSASDSPSDEPPAPVTDLVATAFDPQSDDGEENSDDAPNVVDGQPDTAWRTSTYFQQLGPRGLKTGVGLVVDLGESRAVREVDLQLVGSPTTAQLFLTEDEPEDVEGLDPVAEVEAQGGSGSAELSGDDEGRYLVVWLTRLPAVDGGFRGEVSEVVVRA